MLREYDFSNAVRNPYVTGVRSDIMVSVDNELLDYFTKIAEENGVSINSIINRCLSEYTEKLKVEGEWL
jgi:predicted HicB family RNase H-like nuclease